MRAVVFILLASFAMAPVVRAAPAPATSADLGFPDLTPAQTIALRDGTVDGPQFDQPGLYALMQNAAWWPPTPATPFTPTTPGHPGASGRDSSTTAPAEEHASLPPDYPALESDPAAHRGDLFTLEGAFAGFDATSPIKIAHFLQPGPWENRAQRWGLVTDLKTQHTALVVLIDPPDRPPQRRTPVRVVARFYMLWHTTNRNGNPAQFPVFVAAAPESSRSDGPGVAGGTSGDHPSATGGFWSQLTSATPSPIVLGLAAILILFIPFLLLRIWLSRRTRRPGSGGYRSLQEEFAKARQDAAAADESAPQAPLPEDPAAALNELQRRKGPIE